MRIFWIFIYIIKKIREFIKKIFKNNRNTKDKETEEGFEERYNKKNYHIKYYEFTFGNAVCSALANWASGSTSYTAYAIWLLAEYFKKYKDIDISELDQWLEEKNECIEKIR